jgi:CheY-like chemotaxis protein
MRILVVEDSQSQREAMIDLLEEEGHQLDGAATAAEARALYAERHHELVLMDYALPDQPAPRLIEALRGIAGDQGVAPCQVVCVTGSVELVEVDGQLDFRSIEHRVSELGIRACLAKPVDLPRLIALISEIAATR